MNFSPFAGHFAGAIPAIHQFATGALVSNSSSAADNRYAAPPSHQHPGAAAGASSAASGSGGGGGSGHMNKYAGHQSQQSQQPQLHYGTSAQSQYAAEVAENGQKHHRGSGLGGAMTNGYHQGQGGSAGEQNQEHGQLSGHDSKRLLQNSTPSSWQAPSSTVADYLSHLPASTLPLSLHHFLKYSAETIKKESNSLLPNGDVQQQQQHQHHQLSQHESNLNHQQQIDGTNGGVPGKKKKKKKASKAQKEKKPRPKPGEIRLTTALDGSTLFCCPECQMAYPERGLLEQHLVGHNLERRFICDICNAALKRKDHLTRHKQSHNPERPFVCTICMKAFKRKEQLTLHFVIHSGEKRHICPECGKGFYRKDHLRKHTRSHIARRVKAELSQGPSASSSSGPANGGP